MNAFTAGAHEAMIKVAERAERSGAVAVSMVPSAGAKLKDPKKKKGSQGDPNVMGMGAFTMRRGGEIEETLPNQQPPKPKRY
jgi:hypothetical protein